MYIYVFVKMGKVSDKCFMEDMGNKYNRNWRRERLSKVWVYLVFNIYVFKVCIYILNIVIFVFF